MATGCPRDGSSWGGCWRLKSKKVQAPPVYFGGACQIIINACTRISNSPSADCESKIGDMRGDFRAILLAKSLPYTNERP